MLDHLSLLTRECANRCPRSPNQVAALMAARTILGGVGIPAERVRQAIVDLEAAFNLAV